MPRGVTLSDPISIARAIPGASRSITSFVASGVTSRGANPVPPVVNIKLSSFSSHQSIRVSLISSISSGTILYADIVPPNKEGSCTRSLRFIPLRSSARFLKQLSLTVRTPTRIWWSWLVRIIPSVAMFPSAVTALTGAGRNQSPERAGRERARFGELESESARGARAEQGRRGRRPSAPRPARVRGRAPSARVRWGMGGGVRARDPDFGSQAKSCGWGTRWLPRETARRRRSEAEETRAALQSARPSAASRQETEGKGEHKLPRLRGWTRARGGATPRIVELVESEGRSERSVAKC